MRGSTASPGADADHVLASALGLAATADSSYVSIAHLLLAMLEDESTVPSQVLRGLDITRELIRPFAEAGAPRHDRESRITTPPIVVSILGTARGLALANGLRHADATHLLLALAYSEAPGVVSMWAALGISPSAIVDELRQIGVRVPPVVPVSAKARTQRRGVVFPEEDCKRVLRAMVERHPPGSRVRWGWNQLGDSRVVIYTDDLPPVEEVVRANVRDASSVSNWEGSSTQP